MKKVGKPLLCVSLMFVVLTCSGFRCEDNTYDPKKYEPIAGLQMVKDINPGASDGLAFGSNNFAMMDNILYFAATDTNDLNHGVELWRSDGTEAGTYLVKDIYVGANGSNPNNFKAINSVLYFAADDGINGVELWQSDGTEAGTQMIFDLNPGLPGSNPSKMTDFDGYLLFVADDQLGTQLRYVYDYQPVATGMRFPAIGTVTIGGSGSSLPNYLTVMNNELFLSATDGNMGKELWRVVQTRRDGRVAFAANLVTDINPTGDANPEHLYNANGTLYFAAEDGNSGVELWQSDGTARGTSMVKDINGSASSYPQKFVYLNGYTYFTAEDESYGMELWRTDGTDAGTTLVKDIKEGPMGSSPQSLTVFGGRLYMDADDFPSDGYNYELWVSDGTTAGTYKLKEICPDPALGSSPYGFTELNGLLYFTAYDSATNGELWRTDGTSEGTVMVQDIYPGTGGSNPFGFTLAGSFMFLAAADDKHGIELWVLGAATGK